MLPPTARHSPDRPTVRQEHPLTALLTEPRLFRTSSIPSPASRFLCGHLLRSVFRACTSRIHAQVPVVTTGQLAKTLRQHIPCGIDVAVVTAPARGAYPPPLIQPQPIEYVPAVRATLARGIPAVHLDHDLAVPLTLVDELPAHLAERRIMDRAGVYPATQPLDVQVLDTDQIEVSHQTRRKRVQGGLALLPHAGMRPRHPQPLLLAAPAAFLPSRKTPLLLAQVSQACAVALRIGDLL